MADDIENKKDELEDKIEDIKDDITNTPDEDKDKAWQTSVLTAITDLTLQIKQLSEAKGADPELAEMRSTMARMAGSLEELSKRPKSEVEKPIPETPPVTSLDQPVTPPVTPPAIHPKEPESLARKTRTKAWI